MGRKERLAAATAVGLAAGAIDHAVSKLRVGDRVRVQTPSFTGDGIVTGISSTWEKGEGTKLYPSFHVQFDDGTDGWFNGVSLTRLKRRRRPVQWGVFLRPVLLDWLFWLVVFAAVGLVVNIGSAGRDGSDWTWVLVPFGFVGLGLGMRVGTLAKRKGRSRWLGAVVGVPAFAAIIVAIALGSRAAEIAPSITGSELATHLNASTVPAVGSPVLGGTWHCDPGPWRVGDTASCDVKVIGNLTQSMDVTINRIDGGTIDLMVDVHR